MKEKTTHVRTNRVIPLLFWVIHVYLFSLHIDLARSDAICTNLVIAILFETPLILEELLKPSTQVRIYEDQKKN